MRVVFVFVMVLSGCGGQSLPGFDGGADTGSPPTPMDTGATERDSGTPDPLPDTGTMPDDAGETDEDAGVPDGGAPDSGMMMMPPPEGLDDAMRWTLTIVSASVPEHADSAMTPWESDGPDPYAIVRLYDTLLNRMIEREGVTTNNTREPAWDDEVLENVPAAMFVDGHATLTIELWDRDDDFTDPFDDPIGVCAVPFAMLDFSGVEFAFECASEASTSGPGYSVVLQLDVAEPARPVPAPLDRYSVEVVSVAAAMPGDWDSSTLGFDPRPDPLVHVSLLDMGLMETFEGQTMQRDNTPAATFEEQVASSWPAAFVRGENDLVVTLYDYDFPALSNDLMGRCPFSVEGLDLTGNPFMLTCAGGDRTMGTVDFDVMLRITRR